MAETPPARPTAQPTAQIEAVGRGTVWSLTLAGLTGLAQIHDLRGDTSIDDRARFDNRYEDHWSLWSDIKIILKTVPKVFKGSGG